VAHIEGEIFITRPADLVFDFVADERNEPRFNPRLTLVEQISAGPIGLGTRFRATTTSMGRNAEMVIEFTAFERPRRLSSATHMSAMEMIGTLTFESIPEGTRMRWSWIVEPHGLLKLLTPLVVCMGRRQERTIWASLKRYLEGQEPPTAKVDQMRGVAP
jgi:hypothetical protein